MMRILILKNHTILSVVWTMILLIWILCLTRFGIGKVQLGLTLFFGRYHVVSFLQIKWELIVTWQKALGDSPNLKSLCTCFEIVNILSNSRTNSSQKITAQSSLASTCKIGWNGISLQTTLEQVTLIGLISLGWLLGSLEKSQQISFF